MPPQCLVLFLASFASGYQQPPRCRLLIFQPNITSCLFDNDILPVPQFNCNIPNQTSRSTKTSCTVFVVLRKAKEFEEVVLEICLKRMLDRQLCQHEYGIVWFQRSIKALGWTVKPALWLKFAFRPMIISCLQDTSSSNIVLTLTLSLVLALT